MLKLLFGFVIALLISSCSQGLNDGNIEENLKNILFEIIKNPEILEKMKKNISKVSLTDNKNMIVKKILSNE